jgi:hypothetical protein
MVISFRSILSTLILLVVSSTAALAVPKAAIIRRDGSYVVQPKIGMIEEIGEDRFVYSLPANTAGTRQFSLGRRTFR